MHSPHSRGPRLALIAVMSLALSTAIGFATEEKFGCNLPTPLVPGNYEGTYDAMLEASGGSLPHAIQVRINGSLRVRVTNKEGDPDDDKNGAHITEGDGDVSITYNDNVSYGGLFSGKLNAHANGPIEFVSSDRKQFEMRGDVSGAMLTSVEGRNVRATPPSRQLNSQQGVMRFTPSERRADCWTLSGEVAGPALQSMQSQFLKQGIDASIKKHAFTLNLIDETGLKPAVERIKQEVAEVQPKPRDEAMKRFREITRDLEREAESRTSYEKGCLKKAFGEGYLPIAMAWLKEDKAEMSAITKKNAKALTVADGEKLHKLIGSILGRGTELSNAGCMDGNGLVNDCGAAMRIVEEALLRNKAALYQKTSVKTVLEWERAATLMGSQDAAHAELIKGWASSVAWAKYKALQKQKKPETTEEKNAFREQWDELYLAARQGSALGADVPSVDELTEIYCKLGVCG